HQNHIQIIGTQQLVGLAAELIKSRFKTPYEKYSVSAFTKPQALSEEISKACDNLKLKDNDKLVICLGENDNNPVKIISHLC
ncbi:hypothetical protein, partial [Proteus faecis]|uniref:hypothetical protein n=1 Tax=Proteus faecis TaxID=2050967 RepID=UPI003075CA8A